MTKKQSVTIVIADDDPDDRMLIEDAFQEGRVSNKMVFVEDGKQLLDYLETAIDTESDAHRHVVLLDLNMPRMDGHQALERIRSNGKMRHVPVIILTTSKAEEDVARTYSLGCNGFISKPVTFNGLVDVVKTLSHYWTEIVVLPPATQH